MIIAKQLKETNPAEYLLYMFYVEDLIRYNQFSINNIIKSKISEFNVSEKEKQDIINWYNDLIEKMKHEGVEKSGHLSFIKEIINEMNAIHLKLLSLEEKDYIEVYKKALPNLVLFKEKSNTRLNDIEASLNSLYMIMLLKMKKKKINKETQQAIDTITKLIVALTIHYKNKKTEN